MTRPEVARVTFAGRWWELCAGATLTIGRLSDRDVRLPDDDHLSRRAALVQALEDYLVIRNESAYKPFVVRPPVGEDRVVEPGAATTSLPYVRFLLIFAGAGGVPYEVAVELTAAAPAASAGPVTRTKATVTAPIELTAAQRRFLIALCEPMLTQAGPQAAPATYAQIGERLGRDPHYARNVLKSLRERLAGFGIPELTKDDFASGPGDFRWPLARWAIRNAWISPADVHTLENRP